MDEPPNTITPYLGGLVMSAILPFNPPLLSHEALEYMVDQFGLQEIRISEIEELSCPAKGLHCVRFPKEGYVQLRFETACLTLAKGRMCVG